MCDITIYPKYSVVSIQDDLGAFYCRYTSQSGCRWIIGPISHLGMITDQW